MEQSILNIANENHQYIIGQRWHTDIDCTEEDLHEFTETLPAERFQTFQIHNSGKTGIKLLWTDIFLQMDRLVELNGNYLKPILIAVFFHPIKRKLTLNFNFQLF